MAEGSHPRLTPQRSVFLPASSNCRTFFFLHVNGKAFWLLWAKWTGLPWLPPLAPALPPAPPLNTPPPYSWPWCCHNMNAKINLACCGSGSPCSAGKADGRP